MAEKEIRIPQQQRAIEKKQRIKATALELFSVRGYHKTSTNEIAKAAGLSIGTFYSYYPDKRAVYEELVMELYKEVLSALPSFSIHEDFNPYQLIRTYVQTLFDCHSHMPAFQKEISILSQQYEDFHILEAHYRSRVTGKLMSLLTECQPLLRITDYKLASMIVENSIEAVIHEAMFFDNTYDNTHLINNLADMLSHYLFKPQYL